MIPSTTPLTSAPPRRWRSTLRHLGGAVRRLLEWPFYHLYQRRLEQEVLGRLPRDDSISAIRTEMQSTMEAAAGIGTPQPRRDQ